MIGTFLATDGRGNEYRVEVWQKRGQDKPVPCPERLQTTDGLSVTIVNVTRGLYQVMTHHGLVDLTSDDSHSRRLLPPS
jgi:hypothetical protein